MTLSQRLRIGFAVGLAVAVAVGATGLVALTLVGRQVELLVTEELPLAAHHDRILRGMVDAETGERGFLLTGDDVSLEPFHLGIEMVGDAAAAASAATTDAEVGALLATEVAAAERWIDTFGRPIVELRRRDPEAALAWARTGEGRRWFAEFRAAHDATGRELAARTERRELLATRTRTVTSVLLSVLLVTGGVLLAVVARRTTRATTRPLAHLVDRLGRLRLDRSVRVEVTGPAEVRAVAEAINLLAAENERFARERAEVVRRLEDLDRQKTDFVSTVSHELRTPLTSIIGYLEMLEDGDAGPLTDDQLGLLEVGQRNAGRLLALIEDLLTLSRIESGTHHRDVAPVALDALVAEVVRELRPRVAGRDLELTTDLRPVLVPGDREQLERVLFNLVGNALKFTPDGGRVEVHLAADAAGARLEVRDSGIGIDADELDRLFDRFFRASTATERAIPGTGLGLAITRLLVDQHGGAIDVASSPDDGTVFTVRLPTLELELQPCPT